VSVCLAVHSSKFRPSLKVCKFSFVSVTFIYTISLPYMSECLPVSLMPNTHFLFRLFFASICCYIIRIAVSIYLSVTFIHTMSPICVCLSFSLPISICFYVIMSVYHVYNCVHLSVTLMSYTCFHINSSYQLTELCRHAC